MKAYRVWVSRSPDSFWTLANSREDAIGKVSAAFRVSTFDLEAEESENDGATEGVILIGAHETRKSAAQNTGGAEANAIGVARPAHGVLLGISQSFLLAALS